MAVSTEPVAGGELRSLNPATLEPVGAVPITAPEDVPAAVAEARDAQERWGASSFEERAELLGRVADLVLERAEELAATITAETGKPLTESYSCDLALALDNLRWTAANAGVVLADERLPTPQLHLQHKRGYLTYRPLGVAAVIAPWNFPLALPLSVTATNVAAGNSVVLKPSELTPLTGELIERLFADAGAPEGLVRVVQGEAEAGEALVRAAGVAKVFFTGSTAVGARVAAACGELVRPVTLELGGKDPMLVFADADVERAVEGAAFGAFLNCGQVCTSVERLYVARELYDDFVARLAARAGELRIGRGDDDGVDLGPLVSDRQRGRVEDLVADALEHGGVAVTGARRPDVGLPGWFYEPTVLAAPEETELRIDREEIFGPVVTVHPFEGEDEAVRLANASRFGLGASVWTRDLERAERLSRRLEAGMVWTNDVGYSYGAGQASWGGVKDSGFGVTHSKHGLYGASRITYTDRDRGHFREPWWYPYRPRSAQAFRGFLEVAYGRGSGPRARAAWRNKGGLLALVRGYFG